MKTFTFRSVRSARSERIAYREKYKYSSHILFSNRHFDSIASWTKTITYWSVQLWINIFSNDLRSFDFSSQPYWRLRYVVYIHIVNFLCIYLLLHCVKPWGRKWPEIERLNCNVSVSVVRKKREFSFRNVCIKYLRCNNVFVSKMFDLKFHFCRSDNTAQYRRISMIYWFCWVVIAAIEFSRNTQSWQCCQLCITS